jgi:Domain of unknown function (DUF4349)
MRALLVLALALALAACGQANKGVATEESAPAVMDMMAGAEAPAAEQDARMAQNQLASAAGEAAGGGVQAQPSQPAGPAPVLYLAYSYGVGLELPAENLAALVERHVQACQGAGPRLCQLVGSNVSGDPESSMNGFVSLRGEPAWLGVFMRGLDAEADAAGGRIMQETTNTQDLTRQIVDSEARQRAQSTLRDRLQDLLRNRGGRLADLLETERELARVQGEIDALTSSLAVMRTRVAMSELTLSYQSSSQPLRGDTFRPLGEAFAAFLGIVVQGLAAIVYLIAGLVSVAIVLIPIVWGLLRWRRARGGRLFGAKVKTAEG